MWAQKAGAEVIPLQLTRELQTALARSHLLVNATSAGLGRPQESPLPASAIIPSHVTVIDLVYSPLDTKLLRDARKFGCRVVDGLESLAAQAADAFDLWTGLRLSDTFFRQAAESALKSGGLGPGSVGGTSTRNPKPETRSFLGTQNLEAGARRS